ncbi:hypothetical protein [Ferruginibacter profundus]
MDTIFRNFYRNFYMRTGGFIPSAPLNQNLLPGDFFQIKNGGMMVHGNIFRHNIFPAEDVQFGYGIKLNPAEWSFSDGVNKSYSGRSVGQGAIESSFEFSKQVLSFAQRGSFLFNGHQPESIKICNWNDLQQALIIRLTTTLYSFRELYVVTESASVSDWALAVAGSDKAELEIATESENFGLVDIFGHLAAKTIQSKDIEYHHREDKRKAIFFKAKKLAIQDDKAEIFINQLISRAEGYEEWAAGFYDCDLQMDKVYTRHRPQYTREGVLDMLQANQLNPNTALQYFKWAGTSMDDIEMLFTVYGS